MKRIWFALLLALFSSSALAQNFPDKPIRFVVSFPPGGGNDLMARLVADVMSKRIGQSVVVENKEGAAGVVGSAFVAKASPDGYTVLVTGDVPITQSHLLAKVPYNPETELMPLVKGASVPTTVLVAGGSPFKTMKDLIDYAKANPDVVSWGTPGAGTSMHAELEMLKEAFGLKITHVPYKGAPHIIADTIGGHITVGAPGLPPAIGGVKSGKLRLLAVWGTQRVSAFPDVPTVKEATGKPELTGLQTWYGFLLPRGVPQPIAAKLEQEIIFALNDPHVKEKLTSVGAVVIGDPAAKFEADNKKQTAFFRDIFKKLGIKAQ